MRDPVRAAHRGRLEARAPGAGLRRGRDLLAAARCLAACGRVWEKLTRCRRRSCIRRVRSSRAGAARFPARCRLKRGLRDGPEPDRPRPSGLLETTSSSTQPASHSPWGSPTGAQPPRHHRTQALARSAPPPPGSYRRPAGAQRLVADRGDHAQEDRRRLNAASPTALPTPTGHGSGLGRRAGWSSAASPDRPIRGLLRPRRTPRRHPPSRPALALLDPPGWSLRPLI